MYEVLCGREPVRHDLLLFNMPYFRRDGSILGEVDILGYDFSTRTFHLYEVKNRGSSRNLKKAVRQLKRARDYMGPKRSVRMYIILEDG